MSLRPGKAIIPIAMLGLSFSAVAAEYKAGEIIVKYKSGIMRSRVGMNALYDSVGTKNVRHYSGSMTGFDHLILDSKADVKKVITQLQLNPYVEYAQPNYILHALPVFDEASQKVAKIGTFTPCIFPGVPFPPGCTDSENPTERPELKPAPADVSPAVADPSMNKLYGMKKIHADEAWQTSVGSKNFIVADIDTGIDYNHEDLAGNVWRNPNPSDKNDIVGYDFVHDDGLPFDDNGHGTHTAGTIGAVGGNGIGVSGVSQKVSVMAVKFLSGEGSGTSTDAIRAIDYAVEHGAKVLSNSWGGPGDEDNQALHDAVERARAKDVLFVAAAGNDSNDNDGESPAFPASFDSDNILSVVATDENDQLTDFSNFGKKTTDVAAPGNNIYSTVPGNKYRSLSGTSMACPHVAGAAALVWANHPTWNYQQVKAALMNTVDHLSSVADKTLTGGRINVAKALVSME